MPIPRESRCRSRTGWTLAYGEVLALAAVRLEPLAGVAAAASKPCGCADRSPRAA